MKELTLEEAVLRLREAIQDAEAFGLVRTENGTPITGAMPTEDGITLTCE